jgi:ABC-type glycerol-3-phosphate transport system substrate-binding protein
MTKFQIILMGIFGVLIVGGVIIFSTYKGSSQNAARVVIWGTISQNDFNNVLQKTSLYQNKQINIEYVQKEEETFDSEFIESLASGEAPDVFILPSDKIIKHRNKIYMLPYDISTQRQFKDSFIEGAEVYMLPEGIAALPISVDPLVMYWNRSLFNQTKITEPPKYWDEFYNLANLISKKDGALNISKSAVAFGEFGNIAHAKEIVLNLAMQAGTPITIWGGNRIVSVLADSFNKSIVPAEAAVNFYTEFANPAKTSYSWNRSLPISTNYFLSGDLALYFGFASEIRNLQLKNPNLNFDVSNVPVSREGGSDVSFGKFNALAIVKSTKNPAAAFSAITILSDTESAKAFSEVLKLPPPRRNLLKQKPLNAYESIFYDSAIKSQTWLDPNPAETNLIFKNMIESITSGRARTGEAVNKASREISALLGG